MTRTVRSRRAEPSGRPLYARALRLRHIAPSGLLCFVFLEGALVLGILLALAELVSWWGVLVLPATVGLMVKFNDLVAGALTPRPVATEAASARAAVLRPAAMPAADHSRSARSKPLVTPPPAVVPLLPLPSSSDQGDGFRVAVSAAPGFVPSHAPSEAPSRSSGFSSSLAPEVTERFGPTVVTSSAAAAGRGGRLSPVVSRDPAAVGYGPAESSEAYMPGPSGNGHLYGGEQSGGHLYEGQGWAGSGQFQAHADPVADTEETRPAGHNAPHRRPWAKQLDVRQQMARQAASRRYE